MIPARNDFPVNYVVRYSEFGDTSFIPCETYEEALLAILPVHDKGTDLIKMPIALSWLLYYSGLREVGKYRRDRTAKFFWEE